MKGSRTTAQRPLSGSWRRLATSLCCGLVLAGAGSELAAERSSNWKMFKAADGLHETYASSLTVSPRGTVWIKHGVGATHLSVYDGFQIQTLPSAGPDAYRVYESRTGQLWSLSSSGLVVYAGEQWHAHPVAEIQAEIRSDPLRQLRQIPLLPAEQNRVLFLLSDRLMEYDSSSRVALLLKHVSETRLGRFSEMAEARDGGVWVTGARGAAKLTGPVRYVRPGAEMVEFLLDDSVPAENLQRPFEDGAGRITVAASHRRLPGQRVLLQLEGGAWKMRLAEANIRQAWPGWDDLTWAYTVQSLLRFDPLPSSASSRERIWAGQYQDVAAATNDVFWLATSEGALRYAPSLWRAPVPVEDMTAHVHAMLEDQQDRLWFACGDYLLCLQEGRYRTVKWPEGFDGSFETTDTLYLLPDQRMLVTAGARTLLFDPGTERFENLTHPSRRTLQILGQLPDGAVVARVHASESAGSAGLAELESFDGTHFAPVPGLPAQLPDLGGELQFLAALPDGDLWYGGPGSIGHIRDSQVEVFGPGQGYRVGRAYCLADMGGGKLWCGGTDRILEFNGKTWSVLRTGFDRITALVKGRDDRVWVGTADGLYSTENGTWVEHGVVEGLPSMGVSAVHLDRRGRLWAGTTRGLSQYHPEADASPPRTLPPFFEEANGDVTGENPTLLLNAVDKWQSTPGGRILFATRLDEGAWSPFTNSMVKTFQRLGAGRHHLEVRAMDRNWNEDPESVALDFRVVLAWYKDPRLIGSLISGAVLVFFFAGLAVNRHLRLVRSYAEVEKIVKVRTRELERANEELLRSEKMRALGTLAAGIAHDFNNILSIIRGSAQIIQSNLEDKDKILMRVSRIHAVVEQGSGIVKTILGLSRVKEKDLVLTDLNAVVEDGIKLLGHSILNEVRVEFRPAPELPPIRVAKELIQQMLLNLMLNAADAMEQRGLIVLSTGAVHHLPADLILAPALAASHVYVAVLDSGCGIDPETLPRIFEPFFTTKALSVRRGTGLGLAVVYELARQLGYGLEVRSTPGKGSTFRIILPAQEPTPL